MNPLTILTAVFSINAPFSVSTIPLDEGAFYNTVAIMGTVRDGHYNRPVPGALVYAVSQTSVEGTTTGQDGRFYFLALLPGNYRLGAAKMGYDTGCAGYGAPPVELNAGAEYDATVWVLKGCR